MPTPLMIAQKLPVEKILQLLEISTQWYPLLSQGWYTSPIATDISITQLYKARWQIELFFKWIKQHLRIKAFGGYTENSVKTQIWIAVSVYVLIAIIRKRLCLEEYSLYNILQVLSVTPFCYDELAQLFSNAGLQPDDNKNPNQLSLFDL